MHLSAPGCDNWSQYLFVFIRLNIPVELPRTQPYQLWNFQSFDPLIVHSDHSPQSPGNIDPNAPR